MKMTKRSHLYIRIQNVLFYILFLTIVGLLAWLGKTYHKSIDVTASKRNSLSESTQQLLSRLDKPLTLVAYVPDDAKVHVALKKLVDKYKQYKSDIKLEFVNPDLNPERAKADGIQYSGQLLIKLGDKSEKTNSAGEQNIVNLLQRLSRTKPRVAVFLEGHDEHSPLDSKSSGMADLAMVLEGKGMIFQPHNLIRTQNIPEKTTLLVIAAPLKDYLDGEVKIIKEYIKNGGNLLWLHDPGSLKGLDDIEQQLGLEMHEGTLLDANPDLQAMLGIKHPAAIAVIDYGEIEITKDLSAHTLFPFATAILQDALATSKDDDDSRIHWQYHPFLSTLQTSWLESGEIQGNVKFDDESDKPGPLTMGMVLTRTIDDNENIDPVEAIEGSKQSDHQNKQQRIVVIGDSDFMQNNFIGQGSNLELASNIFNWLSADDDLLSIKPAIASDTKLQMPVWGLYGSAIFFLLVLPVGLLVIGLLRWYLRRKR